MTTASPQSEVTGITLFSLNNNLQTGLLTSLISEKMGLSCDVINALEADTKAKQLLLIDCQGLTQDALRSLVSDVHNHKHPFNAALLNAEKGTEHENMLDWPCISGLFFTDTDQEQLIRGLQCLFQGELWVPRRLLHHFLEKNRRAPSNQNTDIKLTKRERQILKLIKDGATNFDIAESLELSEHTIKSHLYNIYKKIGVRNRLEASNWVRNMDEI